MPLSESDKAELISLINAGRELPERYRGVLFPVTSTMVPLASSDLAQQQATEEELRQIAEQLGDLNAQLEEEIRERTLVEEALRKQKRVLDTLVDNLPGFAYRCKNDESWTMEYISAGCLAITGHAPDDFINNAKIAYNDIILAEYQEKIWHDWQEALTRHEPLVEEYPIITATGEVRWVWEQGRGIYDPDGSLLFLEGFITDITARKRSEAALHQSERRYQTFINTHTDIIFVKDAERRFSMVNQATVEFFGKPRHEILGRTEQELLDPASADICAISDRMALNQRTPVVVEEIFGDQVFETTKFALPLEDGTTGIGAIMRDVSERRRAQQRVEKAYQHLTRSNRELSKVNQELAATNEELISTLDELRATNEELEETNAQLAATQAGLASNEQFLRAVLDSSPIGISVRSRTGRLLSYNQSWQRIWAIPDEDVLMDMQTERVDLKLDERDAYSSPWWEELRRLYQVGGTLIIPEARTSGRRPGSAEWISQVFYAIPDKFGEVDRVVVLTIDVSERKRAEQALQEQRDQLSSVLEQSPYAMLLIDEHGQVVSINQAGEALVGRDRRQVLNQSCCEALVCSNSLDGYTCDQRAACHDCPVWESVEHTIATGEPVYNREGRLTFRTGEDQREHELLISTTKLASSEGKLILLTLSDISELKSAEAALRASEQRYRDLIERSQLPIAVLQNAKAVFANEATLRLMGYASLEEMRHLRLLDAIAPDHRDLLRLSYAALLQQSASMLELTLSLITKQGARIWVEAVGERVEFDGQPAIQVSFRDVTERKRVQTALQASENRYHLLFENLTAGFALHEMIYDDHGKAQDYRFLEINPAFERLTGASAAGIIGRTVREAMPETEQYWIDSYAQVVETGQPISYQNFHSGLGRYFDAWAFRPQPGQFAVIFTDITERVRAEQALKTSEGQLRILFDTLPDFIWLKDPRGVYLSCNNRFEALFGTSSDQIIGKTDADFSSPEEVEFYRQTDQAAIDSGKPKTYEEEVILADGTHVLLETTKTPMFDTDGSLLGVLGIGHDITKRKRAEAALNETLQRLEATLNTLPDLLFEVDSSGVITDFRVPDPGLLYTSPSLFPGKTIKEMLPEPAAQIILDALDSTRQLGLVRGVQYSLEMSGGVRWYELSASVKGSPDDQACRFIVLVRDVTARKRAEDALRQQEERYRLLAETAQELIAVFDRDGRLTYLNKTGLKELGYTAEEAAQQTLASLAPPGALRDWVELHNSRWTGQTEVVQFSTEVLCRDGHRLPLDVNNVPIIQGGQVTAVLSIGRNASERLKAEQAEARLRQVQKMEALGTLAGGIAHDFNNMLFAILGNAELIRDELPAGSSAYESIGRLMESGYRAKNLVQQILTFSRQTQPELVNVDLASLVKEIYRFLRATMPTTIEVVLDLASMTCSIKADPTELHQVVMNLVTNAAQALGEEPGRIEISVRERWLEKGADLPLDGRAGQYVELQVSDTGPGVAPEHISRIFEPFFTTKEVGQGTGMGLAVVHGIVSKLGGNVQLDSHPGQGARFTVLLPAESQEADEVEFCNIVPARGSGRILVAEDEPEVRHVIVRMLAALNYSSVEFATAPAALAYLETHAHEIDLVFSDQAMPGMSGAQLAQAIKERWPALPVILCTGYSTSLSVETAIRAGVATLLYKPVLLHDLAEAVKVALTQPG